MKKVLISGAFTGQVVAMYGEAGINEEAKPPLLFIDYREAVLADRQKQWLKDWTPLRYGERDGHTFEQQFGTDKLRIVVVDEEVDCKRDFYDPYGKKVNWLRVEKEWKKLKVNERPLVPASLGKYDRHLLRNPWKSRADPETYLKKKMFLTNWDEVD